MPWSGGSFTRTNGVNTGATLWEQDRDDGTKILATRHDTNDQDMADGINSTLEKSGSNAATGNLDIGSNRITLVADGTAKTDVATVNQIQSNGPAFQATDTGTANTYVIALTPAITAYAAGQEFTFKAGAASTTASTLNVNTLGAKALKKLHDQDIASGDIESGSIVTAVYDGTNFQVTSQLATETNVPAGAADNLVINGGMTVAQRGSQTGQYSGYTAVDRFWFQEGGSIQARFTTTQDGSGGGGHANSLKLDTTTAESTIASGDLLNLQHRIEAQNLQHLQWGSASAEDVTLSFWMSSPKTGTHCVSLYQADATRSYISEFTIASANTFEYFSVTIPGDTGGTINDDTGAGLYVSFPILSGTTYQAAAGSWLASEDYATSNQQNLADSTSNNIFVTGVQLEVGSVATSFAYEGYGTTLNKCYRYYERLTPNTATRQAIFQAYNVTTTVASGIFNYTHKRAAPTVTFTAGATFEVRHQTTTTVCTAAALSGSSDEDRALCNFTVSSGLTAGQGCIIRRNDTDTTYVEVSSEL
jgi:hypothetical protein